MLKALHRNGTRRPSLTPEQRAVALEGLADDIRELEQVTGRSYDDWLGPTGAGDFGRRHLPNQRTELR